MKVSKNYGILDTVLVTTRFSNFKEFWKNGILPARNEATHRVIAPHRYRLRRRRAARRAGHGRELCRDLASRYRDASKNKLCESGQASYLRFRAERAVITAMAIRNKMASRADLRREVGWWYSRSTPPEVRLLDTVSRSILAFDPQARQRELNPSVEKAPLMNLRNRHWGNATSGSESPNNRNLWISASRTSGTRWSELSTAWFGAIEKVWSRPRR